MGPFAMILTGLPGTGKATWANKFRDVYDSTDDPLDIISAKQFQEEYQKVSGDPEAILSKEVMMNAMRMQISIAIAKDQSIVVDYHNITKVDRRVWLAIIPPYYRKIGVVFKLPSEILIKHTLREGIDPNEISTLKAKYVPPSLNEFQVLLRGSMPVSEVKAIIEALPPVVVK